jgi:hypothetical protein
MRYYLHRFDSRTWGVLVNNGTERTLKEDVMSYRGSGNLFYQDIPIPWAKLK